MIKPKNVFSLVIILLVFISFQIFCKAAKENQVIEIGAILPLTGTGSEIGQQHKMGLDLAVEEINNSGGMNNKSLIIKYEDDKNDQKLTVTAFNKLADIDKVPLIITVMSGPSMAIYPLSIQKEVVLFANCGHPEITSLSNWVFRNFPTSKHEAETMVKFAKNKLGLSNLAILYVNDAFGEAAMKTMRQKFQEYGGVISAVESFEKDGADFRSSITKILQANPQAVYVYGYGKSNGLIVKQLRESGYSKYILGSYNFSVEPTISIAKDALEGSFFTEPSFNPQSLDPKTVAFVSAFRRKFNMEPVWNAVLEYDAVNIIKKALEKNSTSGPVIKATLEQVGDYEGIAGKYTYSDHGEWVVDLKVETIKDGKIVNVEW